MDPQSNPSKVPPAKPRPARVRVLRVVASHHGEAPLVAVGDELPTVADPHDPRLAVAGSVWVVASGGLVWLAPGAFEVVS